MAYNNLNITTEVLTEQRQNIFWTKLYYNRESKCLKIISQQM